MEENREKSLAVTPLLGDIREMIDSARQALAIFSIPFPSDPFILPPQPQRVVRPIDCASLCRVK